ncbi:MAG: DNA adenine methylase, partial [Candidatus Cloacimonetes bacterium]|nr:DNA adenine methylase [Candidatus Cloacimonadota bacterium]
MSKQVEGITKEIFETKKIDKEWSFSEFTRKETAKWTNCYHRYPAKFIPQLVEKLMDEYIKSKNAHINDPFMGSGTTIVSAIARGYKASGTDINKIAYLMTKVKATSIEPYYLRNKIKDFLYQIEKIDEDDGIFSPTNNLGPLIPEKHIERINYWFNEKNKIKLGKILRIIYNEKDENIRNFFKVAFSHILKNCSIWLQGSTKPTRDFKKNPMTPNKAIARHLKKMER